MRPAGEIRQALLNAALELVTPERAPTVAELAAHSQVGFDAALHTVRNMRRAGHLAIVRERRVDYRNRPVCEYAPATTLQALSLDRHPLRELTANWRVGLDVV